MKKSNAKIGWVLSAAGVLLLLLLGQTALVLLVVPAALVLACGLVWIGQRLNRVTHGLE